MIRSLVLAAMTFVGLGAYYQVAAEDTANRPRGDAQAELIRIARSSALFGVNRTKEALLEKWVDQRMAGGYAGGRYRTVAVLRRSNGTVRSVGIAGREGGVETRYSVRVDVFRRMRSLADASAGYDVLMRAPGEDVADHELSSFMESSR